MSSPRGVFLTFEGGEGCGKSTQVELLASHVRSLGLVATVLREPGSTPIGESIRSILLDRANSAMSPRCELLLYEAARAQMIDQIVLPALERGEVVICDRFTDSTMAYQGAARGLGAQMITQVEEVSTLGLAPDRTILLERPTKRALEIARSFGGDRIESEPIGFHEAVGEAFSRIAEANPERVRRVHVSDDALSTAAVVAREVRDLIEPLAAAMATRSDGNGGGDGPNGR